jgi:hypothetical protein
LQEEGGALDVKTTMRNGAVAMRRSVEEDEERFWMMSSDAELVRWQPELLLQRLTHQVRVGTVPRFGGGDEDTAASQVEDLLLDAAGGDDDGVA